MLRLQMSSKMVRLGMNSTQPTTSYSIRKPKLNLQIKKPEISIRTTKPRVLIDQTEAFADVGLKKPLRLSKDFAAESRRLMLHGIAKSANQGDELTNIHQVSDDTIIADQAEYNAYGQFVYEWNYDYIPKNGPRFSPLRGEININLNKGQVNGDFQKGSVETTLNRGKVDIYLRQRNQLNINVVEGKILDITV